MNNKKEESYKNFLSSVGKLFNDKNNLSKFIECKLCYWCSTKTAAEDQS